MCVCLCVCLVWEGPWISKFFHVEHWSPPDKARGLGFELAVWITYWVPRGAVSLNIYMYPWFVKCRTHFFFFCCFLVTFFFTSNTHTSTTVVVSGNIIQYWWWRTLKEHGPMGMKKKKLQQSIKIEQCITVMLNLEKQTYMSTQQKRAKKREREKKRNWHIKLEMHTLSPQWDICFFFHM